VVFTDYDFIAAAYWASLRELSALPVWAASSIGPRLCGKMHSTLSGRWYFQDDSSGLITALGSCASLVAAFGVAVSPSNIDPVWTGVMHFVVVTNTSLDSVCVVPVSSPGSAISLHSSDLNWSPLWQCTNPSKSVFGNYKTDVLEAVYDFIG